MVRRRWASACACVLLVATACGGGSTPQTAAVTKVTKVVSPAGTTPVELPGGPSLLFDPGAVSTDTTVTIQVSSASIPSEYGLVGASYDLKPDGLVFAPGSVHLTLPLASGPGSIWVSSANGYDALPTTIGGGKASAELPHFSTIFTGAPCAPGTACTPTANPCHHGTTQCSGPPLCADLGTDVTDGTACCTGGTCTSGFCEASTFGGSWKATGLLCGGAPALASWITPPSIFRITQNGTTGYSIWTNGSCTVQQLHDVVGNFACLPSAAACQSYSTALFGIQICGLGYDDTTSVQTPLTPIPACRGGTVTIGSTGDTPCPSNATLTITLVRE